MKRILQVLVAVAPVVAFGQSGGTIVAGGAGTQTDPHVSGDWVAYTNFDTATIHFLNLLNAGSDQAIPHSADETDALSDVSGNAIVFNRNGTGDKRVMFVGIAGGIATAAQELSPLPAGEVPLRQRAAIGNTTVAYEDIYASSSSSQPEISISDTSNPSAPAIRLTNDGYADRYPAVGPAGDVIAFVKSTGTGSDIYVSRLASGTWSTPYDITGGAGNESFPDTNGSLVVYGSDRGGVNDIYYYDLATAAETGLLMPGLQQNPNISGSYIAYESDPGNTGYNDIWVYDLARNTAFAITNTPAESERLNDIYAGSDGWIRVVWAAPTDATSGLDVYAARFQLAGPPPCDDGDGSAQDPALVCENPGHHPLLADVTVDRTTGAPDRATASFAANEGDEGVLCIDNDNLTAGWVELNGALAVGPSSFKRQVSLIAHQVDLAVSNTLVATGASGPGTSFRARIYGPTPACAEAHPGKPAITVVGPDNSAQKVQGVRLSVLGDGVRVLEENVPVPGSYALGCASTSGGTALGALLAVLGALLLARRPALARSRARR